MVRLDAVAYLWKQLGTSCIHLPQTHEVVKLFRDVLEIVEPGGPDHDRNQCAARREHQLLRRRRRGPVVYQFSLPPLFLHALLTGNSRYLSDWADGLEAEPPARLHLSSTSPPRTTGSACARWKDWYRRHEVRRHARGDAFARRLYLDQGATATAPTARTSSTSATSTRSGNPKATTTGISRCSWRHRSLRTVVSGHPGNLHPLPDRNP